MKITLTPEESEQMFYDSLCNSLGYMGGYGLELDYDESKYKKSKKKLKDPCYEDVLLQMLKDGYSFKMIDREYDGTYTRTVTLKDVHEKVCQTPIRHLMDKINENDDCVTGDVIIQTVLYGEVIFG